VPGFSGGFVGVDVFFVLSGFLITRVLLDDADRLGTIDFGDFYARRIRRILPALTVVIAFATAAIPFVSVSQEQAGVASTSAVAAVFFYSNVFFSHQTESYFAPQLDLQPLLHTWSLAIEEQFYLLWPLAIFLLIVLSRRFAWNLLRAASGFFLIVLAGTLAFSIWRTWTEPIGAFYLMPSRAWELASGALLLVHAERLRALSPSMRRLLRLVGLLGITAAAMVFTSETPFPGAAAILPVASTVLVLAGVQSSEAVGDATILTWRPVVFIGLLSYSWYLWHWTLLALRRSYVLGERSLGLDLLMCAVALPLAYLTYRYVETPVRTMRVGFLRHKRWTFAFGAALCAVCLGSAQAAAIASNSGTSRLTVMADSPPLLRRCSSSGEFRGFPTPDSSCTDGAQGSPIGVVLWGDSHAGHLLPMVGEVLRTRQLVALQRTRLGCPPVINAAPVSRVRIDTECARFNQAVVADLADRRSAGLKAVVLSARWAVYLTEPAPDPADRYLEGLSRLDAPSTAAFGVWPHDKQGSAETLERSLRDTFEKLRTLGLDAIVVAPTPEMTVRAPACLLRRPEVECGVSRRSADARRATALAAIRAAATGFDHVRLWDPIDRFCDANRCHVVRDGELMYFDANHLTSAWSRHLAIDFEPILGPLIGP
jgi:peptidoglycan/LPS O-acetylase OafA/YrhL